MTDPAKSSLMAAISNMGTYAFAAYDDPTVDGLVEETTQECTIHHLRWEYVNAAMDGVLKIELKDAENLRDSDGIGRGHSDPYVVFSTGGAQARSETKPNTAHPKWNSTHYLFLRKRQFEPAVDTQLRITVLDHDSSDSGGILGALDKDDHIGGAVLDLDKLRKPGVHAMHLELEDERKNHKAPPKVRFTVQHLSVQDALHEMEMDENSEKWMEKIPSSEDETDWSDLTLMTDLGFVTASPVSFITSRRTGTQGWVHVNEDAKVLIIAFRGTEMTSLKDVLTDGNFFMSSMTATTLSDSYAAKPTKDFLDNDIRLHRGFRNAYDSVRESVLRIVYDLTDWDPDWTVCVTGHSLGGALATLCAFELVNRKIPVKKHTWTNVMAHFSLAKGSPDSYVGPKVGMMNFGAPKTGNDDFVRIYNKTVSESLRIVTTTDLVHYLPPFRYEHTKYQVDVKPDGAVIVQGKSWQSGIADSELQETIDDGEDENKFTDRAFSRINVASHLQPYYYQTVQAAVSKFFKRDLEVRGRPLRILRARDVGPRRRKEDVRDDE